MGAVCAVDPGRLHGQAGPRTNNWLFIDAILWIARPGGHWRDLPERFGDDRTEKRRYYDWIARDMLTWILETLSTDADLE